MTQYFSRKSGFSMVELMITVSLIGILAAIGIVQYEKFQQKSRTSEAKLSLGALYTAEQAFLIEWSSYAMNLNNIGFGVIGQRLNYTVGFTQSCTTTSGPLNYPHCTNYPSEAPPEIPNPVFTFDPRINGNPWLVVYFGCYLNSSSVSVNTSGATWTSFSTFYGYTSGFFRDTSGAQIDISSYSSCDATPGSLSFTAHAWGSTSKNPTYLNAGNANLYYSDSLWSINHRKEIRQIQ
ncbi:MAG TPA: type II secretion system protein [Pseudobdellovibrionaceae bacterium]|nr:type II secretion system protein [Pseudobdellovibrionaceae bacterium]